MSMYFRATFQINVWTSGIGGLGGSGGSWVLDTSSSPDVFFPGGFGLLIM